MSTEINAPLAIPESVVVGTGSYTIPANKYAFVSTASTVTFYRNGTIINGFGQSSRGSISASANSNQHYLVAGNTITTSTSFPTVNSSNQSGGGYIYGAVASAIVNVNGVNSSPSYAGCFMTASTNASITIFNSTGTRGWSAAIFPIPKNNLLPSEIL
jgi:hypothetical protein